MVLECLVYISCAQSWDGGGGGGGGSLGYIVGVLIDYSLISLLFLVPQSREGP